MAEGLELDVVTPERRVLHTEVQQVTAPGVLGEFGVLPGHVPFVTGLQPGVVVYRFAADLYYANANRFNEEILELVGEGAPAVRALILEAGSMFDVDYSGGEPLKQVFNELHDRGVTPSTGANNWVVTHSVADNMICYAVSATDVDQTTGTSQDTGSCPASSTSISNAVTSAGDNDLVMDIVGIGTTGHTLVAGADQTERMNRTEGTAYESAGSTQLGSIAGDAMSWTWTTSEISFQSVVAIKHFVPSARVAPIILIQ